MPRRKKTPAKKRATVQDLAPAPRWVEVARGGKLNVDIAHTLMGEGSLRLVVDPSDPSGTTFIARP